ncbi:hypothetical protein LF41_2442 [Lysobacter dokdonensis DS-58]|uniref:Uncharacterized protein n=1 Tax=Lysobacter dokdonensis DS-58 TaxID=1300345 RepID=A0A0A2WNR3_9GAMM|nr:hypothetical protein LF41_2442 [Lysobacter dokdonensis DS-58]
MLRLIAIPRKEWSGVFEDLRVMEAETLKILTEQREHRG